METFNLSFPIQKIDKKNRIVTGIATADNVDSEDDVIEFDASVEAFSDWIGNIREMHQPNAVGKMVSWRPVPVIHRGKTYNGIEVSVYISRGAQDTWEKIMDQTLRGFSIGGRALEKERRWIEEEQKAVNVISRYVLGELSVVDNPANPAGMFTMIKRAADGALTYRLLDEEVEAIEKMSDVYYCFDHKYATIDGNQFCPVCSKQMEKIGESQTLNAEVVEKMISALAEKGGKFMDLHINTKDDNVVDTMEGLSEAQKQGIISKLGDLLFGSHEKSDVPGASNVTVNIDSSLFKSIPEAAEAEEIVEEKAEEIEKSVTDDIAETPEPEQTQPDNKEEIDVDLEEILEKFTSVLDAKLDAVKSEIQAEVTEKMEGIEKSVSEVTEKVDEQAEEIEKVANSGATQKSEVIDDETEDEEVIEKSTKSESFWGGIFVPSVVVEHLGYDS